MTDIRVSRFIPYWFKIIFTLGIPHLGLHHGEKVISPVAREHKVFERPLPDGGTLQIDGSVRHRRSSRIFLMPCGFCRSQDRGKDRISHTAAGACVNRGAFRSFRGLYDNNPVIPGMAERFSEIPGLNITANRADIGSVTGLGTGGLNDILCRNILVLMPLLGICRRLCYAAKHSKRE